MSTSVRIFTDAELDQLIAEARTAARRGQTDDLSGLSSVDQ